MSELALRNDDKSNEKIEICSSHLQPISFRMEKELNRKNPQNIVPSLFTRQYILQRIRTKRKRYLQERHARDGRRSFKFDKFKDRIPDVESWESSSIQIFNQHFLETLFSRLRGRKISTKGQHKRIVPHKTSRIRIYFLFRTHQAYKYRRLNYVWASPRTPDLEYLLRT